MDNSKLETEWAWSQVEAMAEGALDAADAERMERAMAREPALRTAVTDANMVLRMLRSARPARPPKGLLLRLLRAGRPPRRRADPRLYTWTGATATGIGVLATAAIAFMFGSLAARIPDPAEQAALRDFAIAMSYLRRSAEMTREEVNQQLGEGLMTAVQISTQALAKDDAADATNGG